MNVCHQEPPGLLSPGPQPLEQDVIQESTARELKLVELLRSSPSMDNRLADPEPLIYLYVSLKSRPISLLFGREDSGKQAAADRVIHLLTGHEKQCSQYMSGHAWWAAGSGNMGMLTESQRRFNIDKFEAVLSEAGRPSKRRKVYFACMRQISPAEWAGMLAPLAFQWNKGYLIRLDTLHFSRPRPFPGNFRCLATMDGTHLPLPGAEFLAGLTILNWRFPLPDPGPSSGRTSPQAFPRQPFGPVLLEAGVKGKAEILRRLRPVPGSQRQALNALFSVLDAMPWLSGSLRSVLQINALVDLANSRADDGRGLFHRDPETSSLRALDLILSLHLLPMVSLSRSGDPPDLVPVLEALAPQLPRTRQYLNTVA